MSSISIIVPCRNERACISAFLDGILRQDLSGFDWEAIIADGQSSDGTDAIIEQYCARDPHFRLIENPGRIVSTGLNLAIQAARGEIILRMDVHTAYATDYVRQCVACLGQTGADCAGGPWRARGEGYLSSAIASAFQSPFSAGGARSHNLSYEGLVDTVYLGCWRRSNLLSLGMFDEALARNQDDELNLRIIRRGGKIWQDPRIVSWYCPRASLRSLFRQYHQYGFWKVAVIRKHHRPASIRHLVPGSFVAVMCGLLFTALLAQITGQAGVARIATVAWSALAGLYAACLLFASLIVGSGTNWRFIPVLPLVFACFQVGYGSGFLRGVWHWRRQGNTARPADSLTALTR